MSAESKQTIYITGDLAYDKHKESLHYSLANQTIYFNQLSQISSFLRYNF